MPEKIRTGRAAALLSAWLIAGLGDTYRTYRAEVPAVIPGLWSQAGPATKTGRRTRAMARKEEQAA